MLDTTHLEKRRQTYFAVLYVPKALRKAIGKVKFQKTLQTTDVNEAVRRKAVYLAAWNHQIELARRGKQDPHRDLYDAAAQLHLAIANAGASLVAADTPHEESAAEFYLNEAKDAALQIERDYGPEVAKTYMAIAEGKGTRIADSYADYLVDRAQDVIPSTVNKGRRYILDYIAWAGEGTTVEDTTRRKAGEYITALKATISKKKTIANRVGELAAFFKWLGQKQRGRELHDDNPWQGHDLGKRSTRGEEDGGKAWTDDELVVLLSAPLTGNKYDATIHDLMRLALLVGGRIEELCALRTDDITERADGLWITIGHAKTPAGKRTIPVHDRVSQIIRRRLDTPDGFLFPGLTAAGPDKRRSQYVSQAFTDFRRAQGLKDPLTVFHSFRRCYTGVMEEEEVREGAAKLLVGHKRMDITFGRYSKGERLKLRNIIERLHYRADVMKLIENSPVQ